ncbi:MAG TPA: M67 family metallopeptidase [Candidatus Sulfotelmatobacter sp.]|nr:M67 family metallopeptidase [Candidatus Sulfotelmatobacter sp.]
MLRLRARHTETVHTHLCRAYPEEGCGVLLGRERDGRREVERVIGFDNVQGDERQRRYLIAPEQFLAAEKQARGSGLDVIGFFHSHPDHPSRPSAYDLEHAWPWYSYLIVSVERGEVRDAHSWRLTDDRSRFEPEEIVLDSPAEPADRALRSEE